MKRTILALMMMCMVLAVTGCGGGDSRPVFTTDIFSDETVDGYITELFPSGTLLITQGAPSVFAGVDTLTLDESRGFLDFALGDIPLDANIASASLRLFIRDVAFPVGSVPIMIELVSFPPLTGADYDRAPVTGSAVIYPILASDRDNYVTIDVTQLVAQAQVRGLDFSIRIMQDDLVADARGVVEIDDTAVTTAPRLRVSYF